MYAIASRVALRAVLLCLSAVAVMLVVVPTLDAKMRRETLRLATAAGEHVIDVEVAETPEEKAVGLMFRRSVPDRTGMLFPYETSQEVTMWMRNTYVPLDMVFIRADGVVHRIEARTEPLSERIIASQGPVTAVLELAGGAAERLGLRPGDRVRHAHFGTAQR
ncbi:MAG: DUF192 domain-containing protein [Hyphomicrobiaceae bacterium]|nr:DUF192 domain-containing protein [Hyphomicrobiaceae bacterium]